MMLVSLAWKEYREQRTIWLLLLTVSLAALYAVAQIFPPAVTNPSQDTILVLAVLLVATAGIYGVVCGALLLAGEAEAGLRPFLHRHAGWRFRLWFGKSLLGFVFSAAFGLALAGGWNLLGLPPLGKEPALWYVLLPAAAVAACAWGLLGGALLGSTMAAAVVGALFGFPLVFGGMAGRHLEQVLLLYCLTTLLPLGLSAAIYCSTDVRRRLAGGRASRLLAANGSPGGWVSLFWLTYRQTRWVLAFFLVPGLAVGAALPWVGVAGWGAYSLLVGVAVGVALFAGDQPAGRVFLGERRVPPARVWLAKMVFAAAYFVVVTGLILVLANVHEGLRRSTQQHPEPLPLALLAHDVGPVGFAAYFLAYGFALGQLLSFLFRKGVVALVLALLLACLVPLIWIPSMIGGGLHRWQLYLPLAPLLLATLMTMRAWLADRLTGARSVLAVAVCVALAPLLTAAGIVYRVAEIPDVGEPFDVNAYRAQLSRERTGKLEAAVREALQDFRARQGEVRGQGPPAGGAPDNGEERQHRIQEQLSAVVSGEEKRVSLELANYLDELCRGPWVAELEAALRLPPEMLENPNTLDGNSRLEIWTLSEMAQVLRARSVQLLNAGDPAGSLRSLQDVYRLARVLRYRTDLTGFGVGARMEGLARRGMEEWLRQEQAPPAVLLRALLTFLADEERQRPSLREALKVEELSQRNQLHNPALVQLWFDPGPMFNVPSESGHGKVNQYLTLLTAQVPWERERLRRRVNRFSARLAGALEFPFPVGRPFVRQEGQGEAERRAALRDLLESEGLFHQIFQARRLNFDDRLDLCRLRALRLQTALVLYQVEQRKTAPALAALVPGFFDRLPPDPYSGQDFRYRVSEGENIVEVMNQPQTGPGWHTWFTNEAAGAGPAEAPGAGAGGLPVMMPGGAGGPGGMEGPPGSMPGAAPLHTLFETGMEEPFATGLASFIGLWAGPPGQNYLTPAWLVPGLDLGPDVLRPVRPGQGVLWSVGPDGHDDGGTRIAPINPMESNAGIDLVFIVPDYVRGGSR